MGLLFTLAILITIGAVGWKSIARKRAFRRGNEIVEDTEPRLIASHAEIDGFMRCTCGGKRIKQGEGPKGDLWRVVVKCGSCGMRRGLLYKLAS